MFWTKLVKRSSRGLCSTGGLWRIIINSTHNNALDCEDTHTQTHMQTRHVGRLTVHCGTVEGGCKVEGHCKWRGQTSLKGWWRREVSEGREEIVKLKTHARSSVLLHEARRKQEDRTMLLWDLSVWRSVCFPPRPLTLSRLLWIILCVRLFACYMGLSHNFVKVTSHPCYVENI